MAAKQSPGKSVEALRSQRKEKYGKQAPNKDQFQPEVQPYPHRRWAGNQEENQWENRANQSCHGPRDIVVHQQALENIELFANIF